MFFPNTPQSHALYVCCKGEENIQTLVELTLFFQNLDEHWSNFYNNFDAFRPAFCRSLRSFFFCPWSLEQDLSKWVYTNQELGCFLYLSAKRIA